MDILHAIGNTSLVRLRKVAPPGCADMFVKLEWENPTGSVELSREPRTYWTDQLNNRDSVAGYHPLAEEIWDQAAGEVDAFVHCVGTAATLRGVASVLKRHKPGIRIAAVEPAESSVLLGGPAGPHKIEGVGIGYVPPLWDPDRRG